MYKVTKALVRKICGWIALASMLAIFGIMFVLVGDIVLRFTTHVYAIRGTYELTEMAMVVIIFLALAITQIDKEHIHVVMFTEKLPFRPRSILNAVISIITTALCAFVFYACVQQALSNMASGLHSAVLFVPLAPFAWIMAAGLCALTIALVIDTIDYLIAAIKNLPPEPVAGEEDKDPIEEMIVQE
jgi:TRAP-type C4-dicarboxylate transport system permease small subunit